MSADNDHDTVTDYDTVTATDIADFLHHLAELRCGGAEGTDPALRAALLARKAQLLTRIANQATRTHVDAYTEQVQQIAANARTAASQARLQLPHQQVGPNHRRTCRAETGHGGAKIEENTGASSG